MHNEMIYKLYKSIVSDLLCEYNALIETKVHTCVS